MTIDEDTKSAAILEIAKIIAEASIEIVKLEQENAELKRLLKLAVEDMENICEAYCDTYSCYPCDICKHDLIKQDCHAKNKFKWRYSDEMERLLKSDT